MKLVTKINLMHVSRYGWVCGVFCHEQSSIHFVLTKKNISKRGRRQNLQWYFSTSVVQSQTVFQQHELPIFAAFLLECHQRLSKSIRDNEFNPKALENP